MLTTLAEIKSHGPCMPGWKKLLRHLGKPGADDEPLGLLTVLDSKGIDDALWVLDQVEPGGRLARHFSAWCAGQVLPIFERACPGELAPHGPLYGPPNGKPHGPLNLRNFAKC